MDLDYSIVGNKDAITWDDSRPFVNWSEVEKLLIQKGIL